MINPHDIYKKLVEAGNEWAEANAAADMLDETKKTLIAKLMNESTATTMSAKEMEALASETYKGHVTLMVEARRCANYAKVKYDSAKMFSELLRTQAATERAANKHAT